MNKKRLLYVVRYPLHEGFHLKQKFDGQLNAFKSLGYQTYFIGYDKNNFYLIDGNNKIEIGKTRFWIPNYFHTFLYMDLYKVATNVIEKYEIDIVYYRSAAIFHSMYPLVRTMKKNNCKFIFEIPTYTPEIKEKDLSFLRTLFKLYSSHWVKKIESMPDLYVFMGDGNLKTFHGVPAIRIENGIDPELMPERYPQTENNSVNIMAISSMNYWHGYDRLINSLAEYDGDKQVYIHMVGGNDGGCLNEWKELAQKNGIDNRVIFHGPLYGKELNKIFDLCDIGVNSMGMYRKGFNDTSELKTREYIARGLPFVSSVYDVVLDGLDEDLWLKISNDDSIPSMDRIVEFAEKTKADTSTRNRLRNYALKTMTWESQYKKVFDTIGG